MNRTFRGICATCRHLRTLDKGREFEKIADTEYTRFSCDVLKWQTKEFYLMPTAQNALDNQKTQICEFWEEWTPDRD